MGFYIKNLALIAAFKDIWDYFKFCILKFYKRELQVLYPYLIDKLKFQS